MNISDNGLRLIYEFEGRHRKLGDGRYIAYRCPAGVWTIHAGVTEGVEEGMIVTEAEGEAMFRKEIAKHEAAVMRLATVDLNQNQFDALVSFSYNCGTGALQKSTLLRKLNAGDTAGAARAFAAWNKGGGKVLPGLVRRRAAESALFLKPVAQDEPDMPQAVDLPSAKPQGSRTVATANVGQGFTLATLLALILAKLGEMLGYAQQILPLVKSYGTEAVIGVLIILSAGFAIIKHFRTEDHVEGKNPT